MIEELDGTDSPGATPSSAWVWVGPGRVLATAIGALMGLSLFFAMNGLQHRSVPPIPGTVGSTAFQCPVTSTRDASGIIASSGDLGLIEVHAGTFPGERVIVLVHRGSRVGDVLSLHAMALGPRGGGQVMWATPASARATAWGEAVFEVNTKPIGPGCYRLVRGDAGDDPGIVLDLE